MFQVAESEGSRSMFSHLPVQYWKLAMAKCPNLKIIYVFRNPKDVLVSFFNFYRTIIPLGSFTGTWDDFFEMFKKRELFYGDYLDHVKGWYSYCMQENENALVLCYEDIKADLKGTVEKMANFLGKDVQENTIDVIARMTTFQTLKDNKALDANMEKFPVSNGRSDNLRRGLVGDWKCYFTKEQSEIIDEKCDKMVKPLGINFTFE